MSSSPLTTVRRRRCRKNAMYRKTMPCQANVRIQASDRGGGRCSLSRRRREKCADKSLGAGGAGAEEWGKGSGSEASACNRQLDVHTKKRFEDFPIITVE